MEITKIPSTGHRQFWLTAAAFVITGFSVYANSLLHVPFYLDDFRNISDNRFI